MVPVLDHMNSVTFFPHLTMEDPPNINQHINDLVILTSGYAYDSSTSDMSILNICMVIWNNVCSQLKKLRNELSLNLCITQF